jgi:hypothetical protein
LLYVARRYSTAQGVRWAVGFAAANLLCCGFFDRAGFAHDIYALLRELDGLGLARIVVQKPPHSEHWRAVNDPLQRAVAGSGAG